MFYSKQIPIKYDVDVFVAGGGPSGVAAAITAVVVLSLYLSRFIASSFKTGVGRS